MSFGFGGGCSSVGTGDGVSIANEGTGVEHYHTGTDNPWLIRRTQATGDVIITTVTDPLPNDSNRIHHSVALADRVAGTTLIASPPKSSVAGDVLLFLKRLVAGTNISIDDITDDSFRINAAGGVLPPEAWQEDSTASISTNSSSFVVFTTLTGNAKVLDGEEWQINMGVLICCPYATAGGAVNAETLWLIETAAGVFTEFDRYSIDEHITIVGLEKSSPRFRMRKLTASMDAPRMRIDVRRSSAGGTAYYWEDPRWGGNRIEPAPPEE